jgi:hypothetical protein
VCGKNQTIKVACAEMIGLKGTMSEAKRISRLRFMLPGVLRHVERLIPVSVYIWVGSIGMMMCLPSCSKSQPENEGMRLNSKAKSPSSFDEPTRPRAVMPSLQVQSRILPSHNLEQVRTTFRADRAVNFRSSVTESAEMKPDKVLQTATVASGVR